VTDSFTWTGGTAKILENTGDCGIYPFIHGV
jgi:hypothetical protein